MFQMKLVFSNVDANGEGHIDYGEFVWSFYNRRRLLKAWKGASSKEVSEYEKLSQMKHLFHRFDSQRKGRLRAYQFRKVLEGIHVRMEDWEFKALFERFDKDGDGFVDYIEFSRFMEEMIGHTQPPPEQPKQRPKSTNHHHGRHKMYDENGRAYWAEDLVKNKAFSSAVEVSRA